MPFDLSGNFTRTHNWQQDRDNGIRILADRHDEEDNNFAAAFNQTFLRNGTVPLTGDLVMNGKEITTIKAGTEPDPSLTWELSPTTGFYQPDPNSLAFSSTGVEKFRMTAGGVTVNGTVNSTANAAGAWGTQLINNSATGHGLYTKGGAADGSTFAFYVESMAGSVCTMKSTEVKFYPPVTILGATSLGSGLTVSGTVQATNFFQTGGNASARFENVATVAPTTVSNGPGIELSSQFVQCFNRSAGTFSPLRYDASQHTFLVGNNIVGASATVMTLNRADVASNGVAEITGQSMDPAITPAVLSVRTLAEIAGTAASPQYGIKVNVNGANAAQPLYGIYSKTGSAIGGAQIGIMGETAMVGTSYSTMHGVHGKVPMHPGGNEGVESVAAVFGEIVMGSVPTGDQSIASAGAFFNRATAGGVNIGVSADTMPGGVQSYPIVGRHNGATVFSVTGAGNIAATGGLSLAAPINFGQTGGVAPPALTTRSPGARIVLYNSLGAAATDFAMGIDTSVFWSSVHDATGSFKWYAGTTSVATLSGVGNLTLAGGLTLNGDLTSTRNGSFINTVTVNGDNANININASAATVYMGVYFSGAYGTNYANILGYGGLMYSINAGMTHSFTVAGATILGITSAGLNLVSGTTASAANCNLAASPGDLLRSTSALRYKADVAPIPLTAANKLREVKPIQFKSKSEHDDPDAIFYGFIAEDVAEAGLDPLVAYAYQEDQYERVDNDTTGDERGGFKLVPKEGERKRADGVQYDRVVVLQQLLINDLYARLEALEGKR